MVVNHLLDCSGSWDLQSYLFIINFIIVCLIRILKMSCDSSYDLYYCNHLFSLVILPPLLFQAHLYLGYLWLRMRVKQWKKIQEKRQSEDFANSIWAQDFSEYSNHSQPDTLQYCHTFFLEMRLYFNHMFWGIRIQSKGAI